MRGLWRRKLREQRTSEWEAHQMAELSRGTEFGKYKVWEAQKSGRCKKLRPEWEARVSGDQGSGRLREQRPKELEGKGLRGPVNGGTQSRGPGKWEAWCVGDPEGGTLW